MFLKHYFTTYLTNRAHLIDYMCSGNIGSISTCFLVHVVVVVVVVVVAVFELRF